MKIYHLLFIIIICISNSQCLGITNFEKNDNTYIINIASEDIDMFAKKLSNRVASIKFDFKIIIIQVILTSIIPYLLYILFFSKRIFNNFNIFLFIIIFCCDVIFILYKGKDYNSGIRSAECALINFYYALENNIHLEIDKSNKINKLKKVFIGDEIEKYGIHALFCEIPGTLPSNNANPESIRFASGGACYNYYSQRKYLDPTAFDYIGDEESQKYRKLQINKKFDLF